MEAFMSCISVYSTLRQKYKHAKEKAQAIPFTWHYHDYYL